MDKESGGLSHTAILFLYEKLKECAACLEGKVDRVISCKGATSQPESGGCFWDEKPMILCLGGIKGAAQVGSHGSYPRRREMRGRWTERLGGSEAAALSQVKARR